MATVWDAFTDAQAEHRLTTPILTRVLEDARQADAARAAYNQWYVRRLLQIRQPGFAALLDLAVALTVPEVLLRDVARCGGAAG